MQAVLAFLVASLQPGFTFSILRQAGKKGAVIQFVYKGTTYSVRVKGSSIIF